VVGGLILQIDQQHAKGELEILFVNPEVHSKGMEHMASFDYCYKIAAVRDWLFRQSK
jgi:hypothetical protein